MKPKLLFVYDMEKDLVPLWKDGLWAALKILEKDFGITYYNLAENLPPKKPMGPPYPDSDWHVDFTLGWGAFGSKVDQWMKHHPYKKGLCIGGNAKPPEGADSYDVLFYETEWYRDQIKHHPRIIHAFGINAGIYKPDTVSRYSESFPLWNYLTVGAFAYWKRQDVLCQKPGRKLAIGQIQKGNLQESIDIVGNLLLGGVAVSDMVPPEELVKFYYMANTIFIPADINGGGERAVLEARACDRVVEVAEDNPKLQELLTCPVWEHGYYAAQLKEGILSSIK